MRICAIKTWRLLLRLVGLSLLGIAARIPTGLLWRKRRRRGSSHLVRIRRIKVRTAEQQLLKFGYALSLRPVCHALSPYQRSGSETVDKQLMVVKGTLRLSVDSYVIFHSIVC